MTDNPLIGLAELGQSVWYDNIHRDLLPDGLRALVGSDRLSGVTSNPSIFQQAISGGSSYDTALAEWIAAGEREPETLYEHLAIADIRSAADVLAPVYLETGGRDGFVSIEVAPQLAHDAAGTINEALRLNTAIGRDNVMIKVPATSAGIEAIAELTAQGLSVNATLLFSVERYRAVAEAYLQGLQRRIEAGEPINHIASVASLFISRIDAQIDAQLLERGCDELLGQAAIINARCAYRVYRELFHSGVGAALERHGGQSQRLLWASTGVKDKRYPPTYYVDALAAPETVTTLPPATYEAYRIEGVPKPRLLEDLEAAPRQWEQLQAAGIDTEAVLERLEQQGIEAFVKAHQGLLQDLAAKVERIAAG
ncbi:transaldolase [Halorhodospira abdelmalekii]|uniref:transaldolase n=1 Tax=Halorhodospira abdelmalekii TaxID=421629 RepID=UPI0019078047|nr:transaldolase [Halorhodospira abdelmalekii]MBK1733725.1 transaldolase [Halorhodospira abdelmalekii]